VARGAWITGNFLAPIARHYFGECIEPFQRMWLYRQYAPIIVRCVVFDFHGCILFSFSDEFPRRGEDIWFVDETFARYPGSRNSANLRTVKLRSSAPEPGTISATTLSARN
jgi:hypothetical protein